jgi:hypothetical protein
MCAADPFPGEPVIARVAFHGHGVHLSDLIGFALAIAGVGLSGATHGRSTT